MSAGCIDMPGILEQNKPAIPRIGILPSPHWRNEGIIGTCDDDRGERKPLERNWTESARTYRVVWSVRIAGPDQERSMHPR